MTNKYPDFFPENIEELIIADGADKNNFIYHRICKNGNNISREAFISSYEEKMTETHNRDLYLADMSNLDIGDFSTSGFEKFKDAQKLLKLMKKHYDGPTIIVGKINPNYGLSMMTKFSPSRTCKTSHIDWWIYQNATPELDFNTISEELE